MSKDKLKIIKVPVKRKTNRNKKDCRYIFIKGKYAIDSDTLA